MAYFVACGLFLWENTSTVRGDQPSDGYFDDLVLRWRIWRGMDQWPEVTARITSTKLLEQPEASPEKELRFLYEPLVPPGKYREIHTGRTTLAADSILWSKQPGNSITIRYNPSKPSQTLCEEARNSGRDLAVWFFLCCVLLIIGVAKLLSWLHR